MRAGIAVMRDRLADPLTLTELAAGVHHFIRVLRDATGQTPHRFLTRLRIERAQRLLTETDLTIGQVAQRCGFANPGSLSTTFPAHGGGTSLRP
ncbi:helix-turn-helix domain-containing protein [Streptomyces sp. WM6378]|uniref:helix-turn-helix domain-containing protein n=1 Tax=Streptomyces sp. WM6378 TaxID=1415557 RepID=UPI0006B025DD|nr:helix-turn-helix transcriptional regulator [Streptomyces sp. WM6378]KOU37835.1 hypothetical protein ADK54_30995 [Streptomyces sp. WM6378]